MRKRSSRAMIEPLIFTIAEYGPREISFHRIGGGALNINVDNTAGYDTDTKLTAEQVVTLKDWLAQPDDR